jgi:hypothetical protein
MLRATDMKNFYFLLISILLTASPLQFLKAHERDESSHGELAAYMIVDASKDAHEIVELLRRLEKGDTARAIDLLREILKADRMELLQLKENADISESEKKIAERGIQRADDYLKTLPEDSRE